MNQGPGYIAAPFEIDDNKRSASSLDSKDKYGTWETSTSGEFMPERWLTNDAEGEVRFNPWAGPAQPFGGGPRACFGG